MVKKLVQLKKSYYNYLDRKAKYIAFNFSGGRRITNLLLDYISELYDSAKVEKDFTNKKFESAYHPSVTPELEFLIARTLYYYSDIKNLDWKIYLRRQVKKTAPDVRIERNKKTIAIIEIKARAGWIQPFFSGEREKKDTRKLNDGIGKYDPKDLIKRQKAQLSKYVKTFKIDKEQIFLLLSTLSGVHRKNSNRKLSDYENDFIRNSGLSKDNLILLSKNLSLNLGLECKRKNYQPTNSFEEFIDKTSKASNAH